MCMHACDRVRALPMRYDAVCARVRRPFVIWPSRWNTHTHMVWTDTINARSCIPAHSDIADRITDSCVRHRRAHVCAHVRAHVCGRAPTHPRRHMRALSVGVERGWLGSQAFQSDLAAAFNADIGAWNTASVTSMQRVCAAFPARQDALGGSSMRRGPMCAAASPMSARVCAQTCGHSHTRCPRV
jgi:hypothetical protein